MARPEAPYSLLPPVAVISGDDALAAATAEVDEEFFEESVRSPRPLGRSWLLDFNTGQFVRHGSSPAMTHGIDTLKMWILNALRTQRFGDLVHSDEFGLDVADEIIGSRLTPELRALYQRAVRSALLIHDRITRIEDFRFQQAPDEDALFVNFTVTTDTDEKIEVVQIPFTPRFEEQ